MQVLVSPLPVLSLSLSLSLSTLPPPPPLLSIYSTLSSAVLSRCLYISLSILSAVPHPN